MKKIIVVKAGGELMASAQSRKKILSDVSTWRKKVSVVFVHGGGPQIESQLIKQNISSNFVGGRRVTSPEAISVIEQVLSGHINKSIVADLGLKHIPAVGLSGRDGGLITVTPISSLGRAGKPSRINTSLLLTLLKSNFLPVISSIGSDARGKAMNINADDAAGALACALKASNLILLTNISGVLDHMKCRIPILKTSEIDRLIQGQVITGGMIPKVQSARLAIQKGVGEVDIINGFHGLSFLHGTRILP